MEDSSESGGDIPFLEKYEKIDKPDIRSKYLPFAIINENKEAIRLKISELSKKTGASIRSIRHYEKKNLISASRLDNGYREFDELSIERIKTIQIYLGLGLTTDQIEEFLSCMDTNPQYDIEELCEEVFDVYEDKLAEINRRINALSVVKQRLEKQISQRKDIRVISNRCPTTSNAI